MPYLSASEVVIHEETLYQVYVALPYLRKCFSKQKFHEDTLIINLCKDGGNRYLSFK